MDLKREALTGVAHLAAVALALRKLQQPDFEIPEAMRKSLSDLHVKEVSWQQVSALAKSVQALSAEGSVEPARHAA